MLKGSSDETQMKCVSWRFCLKNSSYAFECQNLHHCLFHSQFFWTYMVLMSAIIHFSSTMCCYNYPNQQSSFLIGCVGNYYWLAYVFLFNSHSGHAWPSRNGSRTLIILGQCFGMNSILWWPPTRQSSLNAADSLSVACQITPSVLLSNSCQTLLTETKRAGGVLHNNNFDKGP